ncbi:MAG: hypothetical protein MJK14_11430, partial [Rivularia sp. ALOHA_DT_140]|nr:hypothetical protein [Rivularia sp. ALOHA_DT_140]
MTGANRGENLAAGDSYTATRNINLGRNIDIGNQYLLFVTDYYDYEEESNETNNILAVPIAIDAPNLVVESTISPTSVISGETVELSWTVNNNGDVQTSRGWYDYIYLSDDDTLDSTDTQLTGQWTNSPLAAGDSYTVTRNVNFGTNIDIGNQYLLFAIDRFNYQGETDETDNVKAVPIQIEAPNLTISGTPTVQSSAALGETISLEYTVSNNGSVTAPADWWDFFYISDDAILDSSDISIGSRYTYSDTPLAAGDSYTATRDFTISNNVGTGNKYLLVETDRYNNQGETDETDNVKAIEIEIGAPNLTISETPTAPTSAILGETISLEYTVSNNGSVKAPSDWYDYFYISDDAIFDSSDINIGSRYAGNDTPLAAGDSYSATYDVTISNNVGTGNKYL